MGFLLGFVLLWVRGHQEQSMRNEIQQLRQRIRDQEEALQGTADKLRSSNLSKESMEHFIVSQCKSNPVSLRMAECI